MATLVLGAAGAALAGPWGAALGSLMGQSVDRDLFGQIRQGPRLGDLAIQTSQYGNQIPRIYGTMRVAGTVVWATELQETGTVESGGKSSADSVSYAYSASFAVALSSRPAVRVGRIWADGKLLRGAAGDFKVRTGFRFYAGTEDQPVDPLIASAEGLTLTPAFRGVALAVFDQLQLVGYGNRIPVITFELISDEQSPSAGEVLADVSGGILRAAEADAVDGYAAHGASLIESVEPLVKARGLHLIEAGAHVEPLPGGKIIYVRDEVLGCTAEQQPLPLIERRRRSAAELPSSLSMTYYEASRDYQAGEKHAVIGSQGVRQERIELPAVMTAEAAKTAVEEALSRRWQERDLLTLRLPFHYLGLQPGDVLVLGGDEEEERWQIRRVSIERFVVVVTCQRPTARAIAPQRADGGRAVPDTDVVAEPTALQLFDIPSEVGSGGPSIVLAAAGGATPWRPTPVHLHVGNASASVITTAPRRSVIGRTGEALPHGDSCLLDLVNTVVVTLHHKDDWLTSCTDDALAAGINAAVIGSEVLQFGSAEPLGGGRFRLSRLLRGRRGTEWAAFDHQAGEPFCLLDPATLASIPLPVSAIGSELRLTGAGLGDARLPGTVALKVTGQSLRPPSPVHLRAVRNPAGELRLSWIPRSSLSFAWVDGAGEAPIGGTFVVRLVGSAKELVRQVTGTECLITAEEVSSIGSGPLSLFVADHSGLAPSPETQLTIDAANQEKSL